MSKLLVDNLQDSNGYDLLHRTLISTVDFDDRAPVAAYIAFALTGGYDMYELAFRAFEQDTNIRRAMIRCSTDSGATYDSTANYAMSLSGTSFAANNYNSVNSVGTGAFYFAQRAVTYTGTPYEPTVDGVFRMFRPQDAAPTYVQFESYGQDGSSFCQGLGSGVYLPSSAVTHIALNYEAQTIISGGSAVLYGVNF